MNQKGLAPILIVLGILVIFVGGYYLSQQKIKPTPLSQPTIQPSPTPADETVNWKTYEDKVGNFSFRYPPHWKIDFVPENTLGDYISFFKEDTAPIRTKTMHSRGNEVFRIMLYDYQDGFEFFKKNFLSAKEINVAGRSALRQSNQIDIQGNISGTQILHLELPTEEASLYIDQILQTFKFLP